MFTLPLARSSLRRIFAQAYGRSYESHTGAGIVRGEYTARMLLAVRVDTFSSSREWTFFFWLACLPILEVIVLRDQNGNHLVGFAWRCENRIVTNAKTQEMRRE